MSSRFITAKSAFATRSAFVGRSVGHWLGVFGLGLSAVVATAVPNAYCFTITAFTAGPTTVQLNDVVTIDLKIGDWTDGEVDAVALNLLFDPAVFTHSSDVILTTEPGSFLNVNQQLAAVLVPSADTSNVGGGVWGLGIEDADIISSPNTGSTADSGVLGSVSFIASALGSSVFSPQGATFVEPFDIGRGFFGSAISPSSASYSGVTIDVVEGGLAGDFDSDNDVDGHDFLKWQQEFPTLVFSDWESNFPTTGTPPAIAVPEPTSVTLLVFYASLAGSRHLRRRS